MDVKSREQNPLQRANCISKLFFWWLKDIIARGNKHDLEPSDVYATTPQDLCEPLGHTLEIAWQRELDYAKSKSTRPSLSRVIIKTYCWTFFKFASLEALYTVILMLQPQLLEMIIRYFDHSSTVNTSRAYAFAALSVVLMALQTALLRHGAFRLNRLGMQIKVACSSLIYKKITRLSCASTGHDKGASAISLLSIDVARFEMLLSFSAFAVILPLQLAGVTYLIYTYVGLIAALSGVALMVLQTIPLQMLYYKLTLEWRAKQAFNTDRRISLIDEIVAGVRAIKMYVWENYFEKLVFRARSLEIQGFLKISYLMSAADSLLNVSHRFCSFVVTLVYILQYGTITVENVLPVRQHFYNLRSNSSIYFFLAVQAITNVRVSIKRIEVFLSLPEVKRSAREMEIQEGSGTILIKNVTASWDEAVKINTLDNVSIELLPRRIHAIVGATGSGKSSLLKLILGELESLSGQVSISGEISYASQEPWLFAESVRENILFGEAYEAQRYDEVVRACALLDDFDNLPYGDRTLVGDRGMSLSGGQRARVNVARAVYRRADVYLLDDPFSAVDSRVARVLRTQCVDQFLKGKTVVLVTHNLHHLKNDDRVVWLNSGEIQFEGSIADLQKTAEGKVLVPPKQTERDDDEMANYEETIARNDANAEPKNTEETMAKGTVSKLVILEYVKAGGYASLLMVLAAHFLPTVLTYKFDFDMTAWTEEESHAFANETLESIDTLDKSVWNSKPLIVIGSILLMIVITSVVKDILLYRFIFTANKNLHNNMFVHLIRTSLQFFQVNPAGRILNRFSEDVGNLDNAMPESFVDMLKTAFHVVGSLVFILIINYWNVVPIALTIVVFARMSCIYVSAVPKIKRLVGSAKSPVLSFVTSTLAGLTTIRSCKAEQFVVREFADRLDQHTAAFFLVLASSMAFAIWIEMLTVSLFACTAFICIALKNYGVFAGQAGLILTTIYEIVTSVSYMVRVFADMCAHMINVERILQYTDLEPEYSTEESTDRLVAESWPSSGEIRFERVDLRYTDEEQPILNDLTFTIEPGTKVGIVGRTGAGKSSLVSALFRLAKVDGHLLIDDVDTRKVDLSRLRSKISIIPQEPVLFRASLRSNLDPLDEFDDATLWSALDSVGLKKVFSSLDELVERGGKNLSLGQRQLLCLARVAARNIKILVLDEATANVDSATDDLLQETIRDRFKDCTVLTIAHRLNTIMDSDKILVMDHGRVVEYDSPRELLRDPRGYFSKMVEQTGERVSQQLKKMAEKACDNSIVESTHC